MAQQKVGVIILAAGNSSRLGRPKQLLPFQGKTLIRHIAEAAWEVAGNRVIVVTGSNAALIAQELEGLDCHLVHNDTWQEGMSSSVKTGIAALQERFRDVNGAVLAVSDQPFVTAATLQGLMDQFEQTNAGIVASEYEDTLGTPALFATSYFPALLQLTGAEGAKKLFRRYAREVTPRPFPEGRIDIDTQEDYDRLTTGP